MPAILQAPHLSMDVVQAILLQLLWCALLGAGTGPVHQRVQDLCNWAHARRCDHD